MKDLLCILLGFFLSVALVTNIIAFAYVVSEGKEYCDNPTKIQYLIPAMPLACWSLEPIEK